MSVKGRAYQMTDKRKRRATGRTRRKLKMARKGRNGRDRWHDSEDA